MDAVAVAENFNNAAAAVASAASAAAVLGHQPHSGGGSHSQQQSSPGNSHSQTALANKNPFAIQELLGLGSNDHQVGGVKSC